MVFEDKIGKKMMTLSKRDKPATRWNLIDFTLDVFQNEFPTFYFYEERYRLCPQPIQCIDTINPLILISGN